MPRPCLIGLDLPESDALSDRIDARFNVHDTLPRILLRDGMLYVESAIRSAFVPTSAVVYHGIFGDDHDLIAGLALWGGPCLPNARAMMDCRLKLPCLVRALQHTRFGSPARGFASAGCNYPTEIERVAKWGNWHCGENKSRFLESVRLDENSIVEPFLEGEALRVVVIGERHWQIRLTGDGWLRSIHHPTAAIMTPDRELVEDTRRVGRGMGLEILANDYIVTPDGVPHFLEVNHIPNVTRFPEIREAFLDFAAEWLLATLGSSS